MGKLVVSFIKELDDDLKIITIVIIFICVCVTAIITGGTLLYKSIPDGYTHEIVQFESGLVCVVFEKSTDIAPSCNWEAYNQLTNYGEFAPAMEPITHIDSTTDN